MDYTFYTEVLKAQGKVLFPEEEACSLFERFVNNSHLDPALALESLHYHHLGYWVRIKVNDELTISMLGTEFKENEWCDPKRSFFVYDLSTFSDWIHALLSKEVLTKYEGYLTKATITLSDEAKEHQDRLLDFLLQEEVIFRVKDESDK